MKKLSCLLILVILCCSCSVFKKQTTKKTDKNKQDTENIIRQNDNNAFEYDGLIKTNVAEKFKPYQTCSFQCKTSFKGFPINMSVRTTYDSIFWFSASSMGVEAVRIKATEDSVYMLDKINKENVQWTYERAAMFAGLPLSFDFIQDLFTDTTLVKSYNTPKFNGTIVKKFTRIDGISLPEEINIDGKINGKNEKVKISVQKYKINGKNEYPFEFKDGYKYIKR
ncbi:MAG: DUF4292 domain-containing protein [Bacteroidales bacterium]|nr:DUF4292 domain-containing protein [Bacteroidales bacterium]